MQKVCFCLTYLKTSGKTAQPYPKTEVEEKIGPKIWNCFRRVFVFLGRELETCEGSCLSVQTLSFGILGSGRSEENIQIMLLKIIFLG